MALTPQEAAELALKQLREEAELRKRIAESAGEYVKVMKDLKNLNKDIANLKNVRAEIDAKIKSGGLTTQQLAEEQAKLDILDKQLANLEAQKNTYAKVVKETNKMAKSLSAVSVASKDIKSIYSGIVGTYSKLKTMTGLFEIDKAIRTASTSMGIIGKRSEMFRDNLKLAAGQTTIFGADIKELATLQAAYSDEIGRSALLSVNALKSVAAMSEATGMGAENTAKMVADFEKQGISAERTAKFIEQIVNDTSRMGVNSTKVIKNMQQNFRLLNRYNFSGGVKGLAKMAERATKLGIEMGIVSGMAEKLFDIEGAVDMSAQLQVLGGEWSKLADPFKLMFMARNDVDALEESVINAASASARFSEETGKFEIGAMEMQRLRKVSEAAGLDFERLAEAAKSAAQATGKRNQIRYSFDNDTKEFIENVSFLNERGEAVINLESGEKLVKNLNAADKAAISAAIKEKANLEERAKASKTFDETAANVVTQFKQLLLPFLEAFDKSFRPVAEKLSKILADKDVIDGIKDVAETAAKAIGVIGKFIAENPGKSLILAIAGIGLFEAAKWFLMGIQLGLGFNTVAGKGGGIGGIMGTRNMSAMNRAGMTNMQKFGANFKGASGSMATRLGGVVAGGFAAYDEFGEQKEKGKSTGESLFRAGLKGTGAGLGAWGGASAGAALGAFGGPLAPITVPLGALIGGGIGAFGGGKLADLDTYGVEDGLFNSMTSTGSMNSRRAILQGGNITPIDNKDDILAMKPGGAIDKYTSKVSGSNVVKHEFGELNINGEIVLKSDSGQRIDSNLLRDPQFVRAVTQMVQVEARKIKNQTDKA